MQIDHALQYAKEKPDVWFGGVTIIFAGDFYQFPPVGGSPLYSPITAYAGQTDAEFQKRLGHLAWKTVKIVISLTEQHRMRDDVKYGRAVSHLRTRECTVDDMDIFNMRVMKTSSHPDGVDMGSIGNTHVTAIVTTNELREALNAQKEDAMGGHAQVVCAAVDKVVEGMSIEMRKSLLHLNVTGLKEFQCPARLHDIVCRNACDFACS